MRKMKKLTGSTSRSPRRRAASDESSRSNRHGAQSRQVHRLPHLFGDLQERLTNREGVEYAWFNNVETKPGVGYPRDWENQKRWNGGWERTRSGKLQPKMGPKWRILAKIFANPDLPEIDDYYEPFDFDMHLQNAPEMQAFPTARPRSKISGQRMEKIEWGPNWEEILGGEFSSARRT